jgi:hypothetical protein
MRAVGQIQRARGARLVEPDAQGVLERDGGPDGVFEQPGEGFAGELEGGRLVERRATLAFEVTRAELDWQDREAGGGAPRARDPAPRSGMAGDLAP